MEQDIELLRARAKAKAKAMRLREEQEEAPVVDASSSIGEVDPIGNDPSESSLQALKAQATFGTMLELGKQSLGFGAEANVTAGGLGALESVPFAKDVFAGALTVADSGLEKFSENYSANKSALDKTINEAEEKHPWSFNAGDLGMGLATFNPSSLGGNIAFGAASALSRSEDRGVDDILAGGTIGAATYGIANKVLPWMGRKLGIVADKGTGEVVGAMSKKGKKDLNEHIMLHYAKQGESLEDATSRWAQETLAEVTDDGKPLLTKLASFRDTAQKAEGLKQKYGEQIGKVMKQMDEALPEGIAEDESRKVYHKIMDELDEKFGKSTDKEAVNVIQKVKDRVNAMFTESTSEVEKITEMVQDKVSGGFVPVTKEITKKGPVKFKRIKLSDLQDTRMFIDNKISGVYGKEMADSTVEHTLLKDYASVLRDEVRDQVDKLAMKGDIDLGEGIASFKELNKRWANSRLVHRLSNDAANNYQAGPFGILKNAIATRGLVLGMLAGGADASRWAAASTVIAFNEVMSNPKTPAALHSGLRALSEVVSVNPDHPALKDILTAASLSSDELRKAVTGHVGRLKLGASKVGRSIQEAYMKSDSILSVVEHKDMEAANMLRDALRKKDDQAVAQIMDSLSKNPEFSEFIESGIGWNGKVYTAEDKAILESQLKANSSITYAQKLRHLESLRQEGIIPQIQPDARQPLQHIPRRKDRHGY